MCTLRKSKPFGKTGPSKGDLCTLFTPEGGTIRANIKGTYYYNSKVLEVSFRGKASHKVVVALSILFFDSV